MRVNINKRKAQEEVVGFILIVVIVAIAFVVFLGIKLRNPEPAQKESEILYQFIESSMRQTTECVVRENGRNLPLNDLIKECHSFNNTCLNGASSCFIAEDTITSMLKGTWKVSPQDFYKGYEFSAEYNSASNSSDKGDRFIHIAEGNCSNTYVGNSYFLPEFPGNIVVQVKLCS